MKELACYDKKLDMMSLFFLDVFHESFYEIWWSELFPLLCCLSLIGQLFSDYYIKCAFIHGIEHFFLGHSRKTF